MARAPVVSAKTEPDRLIGSTTETLTSLLGPPEFVRRDQGAEVWHYPGETCTLLVYLYAPKDGGLPTVSFIDARAKHAGTVPKGDCLAQAKERHARTG